MEELMEETNERQAAEGSVNADAVMPAENPADEPEQEALPETAAEVPADPGEDSGSEEYEEFESFSVSGEGSTEDTDEEAGQDESGESPLEAEPEQVKDPAYEISVLDYLKQRRRQTDLLAKMPRRTKRIKKPQALPFRKGF